MLDEVWLKDGDIAKLNKMGSRKGFLDDIWFRWNGTARQFENFKNMVNLKGGKHSFTIVDSRQRTADFNGSGGGESLTADRNNRKMVGPIDGL